MNIREAIEQSDVLRKANPASIAALTPFIVFKRVKKGEHIFFERDMSRHMYIMADGVAALYKLNKRQERRVIFICKAGETLNEVIIDGNSESVNCEILSDSLLLCVEKYHFLEVCRNDFDLSKALMDSISQKNRRLYRQMKNTNNTVRGDRRIAAKLWKLSKDYGRACPRGIKIGFELTITFLADMLGSKRETVSRQLKLLTDKELVIIDKTQFIIPDRDALLNYFNEA